MTFHKVIINITKKKNSTPIWKLWITKRFFKHHFNKLFEENFIIKKKTKQKKKMKVDAVYLTYFVLALKS
jgi:hypothetical protein